MLNNSQAIRTALEKAGVRFTPTGAEIGPTVPITTELDPAGTPIRWVNAQDLSDWANRVDGSMSLPTLLDYLILATNRTLVRPPRFPSDEGVRHPGWDGQTEAGVSSEYVPQGTAGWEISAQKNGISQKATDDYRKRTANPAPITPATSTYIFVTPRHWPQKDEWAAARRTEGLWNDVRVYDVNDLVHWIEQAPGVGLWLATRLGKRPSGTQELDDAWIEWSGATRPPLTEDLVLSDRDQDAGAVLRWLRHDPCVLSLQATTADEAVAFFHATLSELPDEANRAYRARSLVVTATAARALANAPGPLILLLTEPEPGLAGMLAQRGHHVLQAYDEAPLSNGQVRTLARPSREGIAAALTAAGITNQRATALARDCARNLTVLRRLIPAAPGRIPRWAHNPHRALLAALLAGGWDENREGDKLRLSELAHTSYEEVIIALTPSYIDRLDAPLQKIGSTWRIASALDAWMLLARHLTATDIQRFESIAHAVLGSVDPLFDVEPDGRWTATVRGVHRDYSGMLREGIGNVLILLALWGDQVTTVPAARKRAEAIVAKLLEDADKRRWWSLSRDFRLLAEASPSAFLSAVEDSLDQNDPPIGVLFGKDEDSIVGTTHLSDLMWALESLAWSQELMARVTYVLARLDALDVKPRRSSNGPAHSLRNIHLLWLPQTFASLDDRLRALDLIRNREEDAAWKLMLGILPNGNYIALPSSMPRWRDFSVDQVESVTPALINRGASAVSKRLLDDVGTNVARWMVLLDRIRNLAPGPEAILDLLQDVEPRIIDQDDRGSFWEKLRKILHKHRQYPNAGWRLADPVLDRIETIYGRFAPTDPLEQIAWLFQRAVQLPKLSSEGWESEQRDLEKARLEAARGLYSKEGIRGILALSRLSEAPAWLGKALYDLDLPNDEIDTVIKTAVCSDDSHERDVAHGLITSIVRDRGKVWSSDLIASAREERWGDVVLLAILLALPRDKWTWDQVAAIGGDIEIAYWKRTPILGISLDGPDVDYATRKLIEVGRARHALALIDRFDKAALPSDLLVELLQKAVLQPSESDGDPNESTMFQYYVTESLGLLDERDDVDVNTLALLEWSYLALLEYSQRPPKALFRALSEQPELFIEMLSAIFKPTKESGVVYSEPTDPEDASMRATQAYSILQLWDRLPGTRDNGTIDGERLESWMKKARTLAKTTGREDVADSRIGTILSASPMGTDGAWPAEPVRDVLDLFRSKALIQGFVIGKLNRRGTTKRLPGDGGALEREEAAMYRAWAKAISYEHPHTAKALNDLADRYQEESQFHDERGERWDW